jgi:tetratricopeptide (TPR) repeat protein
MRRFAFLAASLLLSTSLAFSQHEGHDMSSMSGGKIGWVSAEILQRPPTIKPGVGEINDPVTTQSKEAQSFYNQGMAYLHSYVWVEAARSFHQALRLDPKLAMAHVGLARTYVNFVEYDKARAEIAKARELSEGLSEREKMRMEIQAKQLEVIAKMPDPKSHDEYKKLLDDAITKFPQDAEIWVLRGNAAEASILGRGQRGGRESMTYYEGALRVAPKHWGANHYLIHSCEFVGEMDCALKHGEIYANAAPAIPHAHHMYGHDLRRVGKIDEAIARFQKADELERAYYKNENIPQEADWHHAHNLSLLATSYQYQGRMKQAEAILLEALAIPGINDYQEFFKKDYAEFLINRKRYKEALAAATKLAQSQYPLVQAAGHALSGNAQLGLGQADAAKESLEKAKAASAKAPSTGNYAAPYVNALEAEILSRGGEREKSFAMFKKVIEDIRATPGPDAWMQAIYRIELVARIGREAGDWKLAEYASKQMLEHDQYYAGTQYALALIQLHESNQQRGKELLAAAKSYWKDSDGDLAELAEISRLIGDAKVEAKPELLRAELKLQEMKFNPTMMT